MSDRLAELRRQRALLEEHLAWIDREIAVEAKQVPVARVVAPHPVTPGPSAASPSRTLSVATAADAMVATTVSVVAPRITAAAMPTVTTVPAAPSGTADAIFEQYRVAPDALKSDVRKGCFLYFTLALLLVGLGVAVLWMALRK